MPTAAIKYGTKIYYITAGKRMNGASEIINKSSSAVCPSFGIL